MDNYEGGTKALSLGSSSKACENLYSTPNFQSHIEIIINFPPK